MRFLSGIVLLLCTDCLGLQHVVRILAMVPIYATNAWFGLRYKSITLYLDVGRDCYEAFVIYR